MKDIYTLIILNLYLNGTVTVHAQFNGVVADILDEIIRSCRASSRTEAIRLALLYYYEEHLKDESDRFAVEKMQRIDKEIEQGKGEFYLRKKPLENMQLT